MTIDCDGYHTPAPQNGDPVVCLRSQAGYCPDSDCPHYQAHAYGPECRTDECGDGERECVECREDQREDG
jgi:hypothetical protein